MAFLPALGAGLSAIGTVMGGIAQSNAASYQSQIAANNAQIATNNATAATAAGEIQAETESKKGAAQIGEIKAGQAASGIDVNTGSAVDVQAGQRMTNVTDAENVEHNALLTAYGYTTQGANFQAQSEADQAAADAAPIGAGLSAAGTLLGDASGVGPKWTAAAKSWSTPTASGPLNIVPG